MVSAFGRECLSADIWRKKKINATQNQLAILKQKNLANQSRTKEFKERNNGEVEPITQRALPFSFGISGYDNDPSSFTFASATPYFKKSNSLEAKISQSTPFQSFYGKEKKYNKKNLKQQILERKNKMAKNQQKSLMLSSSK